MSWVRGAFLIALAGFVLAVPQPTAAQPQVLTDGDVRVTVAENETLWPPGGPSRVHLITVIVHCGSNQTAEPHYSVALTTGEAHQNLSLSFNPASLNFDFASADCLTNNTNSTKQMTANVTLTVTGSPVAFTRLFGTITGTLKHAGEDMDVAQDMLNLTVGYFPGIRHEVAFQQYGLADDRATIPIGVRNQANGATTVTFAVVNRSQTLVIDLPEPVTLPINGNATAKLNVTADPGCGERFRTFRLEVKGASNDTRAPPEAVARTELEIQVQCEPKKKGALPAPELGVAILAALALAWTRRR